MPGSFTFAAFGPVCEIGLGSTRAAEPDEWLDVSCYVHEAETFRGRERFNERFEPGTLSLTFDNRSGWGDLVGAPIAVADALLRPGRPIRIGIHGPFGGAAPSTRWLWRGWIDQAQPDYDPVLHDVVTINCIDALGEAGQSIAPAGPSQGAHETADQRVVRVLDSVGWFASKRKIFDNPIRVQPTTLGTRAIDLMTIAADTAGGVVYADLDGDVVFRGMDWMLYDPDIPPDGEIGNAGEGTAPLPDEPPYLDPVPSVIYDPDPGTLTHPDVIEICIAPDEGTVVEQGDAWRVFIRNGHLWYESSGHLWDMGPWEPDDTCVTIDTTGPPTATKPGGPEFPGVPEPWPFAVEFLGYSDGGLADPPTETVTIPDLSPGPDCLLVVLINALCDSLVAGSLTPFPISSGSISGGGLTWNEIALREPAGFDGAESYGAAAEIGRSDPGTFDLIIDWSGDHRSRSHIATIWKVTGYRADMLQRMRLGAYLHAATWDRTSAPLPSPNPPGKGPTAVPFTSTDTDATAIVPFARPTDITIAQSLAESPNPPFGASFDDSDGSVWVVPEIASGGDGGDGAVDGDDFERPDSDELGPNWFVYAGAPRVESGAFVVGTPGNPASATVEWAGLATGADHYIEIVISAFDRGSSTFPQSASILPEYQLRLHGSAFDYHVMMDVSFHAPAEWGPPSARPNGYAAWNFYYTNFVGGIIDSVGPISYWNLPVTWGTNGEVTVRFEADADGSLRAYFDGELVAARSMTTTMPTGQRIGFTHSWSAVSGGPPLPPDQPRIESVELSAGSANVLKCSWIAGYREMFAAPDVAWSEVNTGPDDIQSCQIEVVIESGEDIGFAWRALGYRLVAPTSGVAVPAGSSTQTIRPERSGIILVAVGAFADPEIAAGITVTSDRLTFSVLRTQATDSIGWAQGRLFVATLDDFPTDPATPPSITIAWDASVEKIGWAIYEVANGEVVSHGSTVRGTHVAGSADGPATVTVSPAPTVDDLALGFLIGSYLTTSDEGSAAGADMTSELEVLPTDQYAWIHTQSRTGSTSGTIGWTDIDESGSAKDVILFGVIVRPLADFANWSSYDPLMIGGARDAYGAPIYSATGSNGGTPIWNFDPAAPNYGAIS